LSDYIFYITDLENCVRVYKCVHTIVCRYGWCSQCFRNKVCKTWNLWSLSLHVVL